jgi:prepilin-type N-terminal cleavage/methylation domain-containing protein
VTRLRLRDSSGFTLVEVMVAALILVVGAGAAFALIDSANRAVTSNAARSGATNLGRELTEYARTTDYDLLQPTQAVTALRKHSQIAGALTGSVWTIQRRGVTYTVSTDVCTFDDPKDGLAAAAPPNPCPAAAAIAGVTTVDVNGDDFRRIKFRLSWNKRGRAGSITQQAAIVNPAGALGPRIDVFDQPTTQFGSGVTSIDWGAAYTLKLTTKTSAASVRWTVDDGVSAGDATGSGTSWGFSWPLGTEFDTANPWVRDGTYTVQTQAFDSRGVPGEGKLITVNVNRHAPAKLTNVAGGYNERFHVWDLRWDRYDERDLQGYRVVRVNDNAQICPATGVAQQGVTCTDSSWPTSSLIGPIYKVVAVDCTNLMDASTCTRDGAYDPLVMLSGTLPHVAAPDQPTGLTASIVDGKPTLAWTAPATVPNGPIRFYRIYRDSGTNLNDRYDLTVTNAPNYVDPEPGSTTSHRYWITAVDKDFNESPPSAYVDSPPVTP